MDEKPMGMNNEQLDEALKHDTQGPAKHFVPGTMQNLSRPFPRPTAPEQDSLHPKHANMPVTNVMNLQQEQSAALQKLLNVVETMQLKLEASEKKYEEVRQKELSEDRERTEQARRQHHRLGIAASVLSELAVLTRSDNPISEHIHEKEAVAKAVRMADILIEALEQP